jgi:hypothetical protein
MHTARWIALAGLLCTVPVTAFADGWRDPRPGAVVTVVPRREVVRHHHWGHRPTTHAVWVPGHWVWVGHHHVYRRGYWRRAW